MSGRWLSGHQGLRILAIFPLLPWEARRITRGTRPLSHSVLSLTENLRTDHARLGRGRLGESEHVHLFTQQTLMFVSLMNESWCWVVNKTEMEIEDLGLVQTRIRQEPTPLVSRSGRWEPCS